MSSRICNHVCINETVFQAVRQPIVDVSLTFPENSRWTKQSFREECDINTIMARYQSSGIMPAVNEMAPQYLDVTGLDFAAMQNQVIAAQEFFGSLPSHLRARFKNDPAEFLEYVGDVSNYDEMKAIGLLTRDYRPAPDKSVPAPDEVA